MMEADQNTTFSKPFDAIDIESNTSEEDIPILLNLDLSEGIRTTDEDDDVSPTRTQIDHKNRAESVTSFSPENAAFVTMPGYPDEISDHNISPVPVTILSGFLGSGKTTLIQHILRSPNHGKRIAVIENEFSGTSAASDIKVAKSEVEKEGLSIETLIARDGANNNNLTDLIELPNGCICCTVKDSLVETLELLLNKKRELDYIIIECSGMANPGPIASVFWLDDALDSRLRLDGVVVTVDARNIEMQLRETSSKTGISKHPNNIDKSGGDEAAQQIAYADRIIINKVDLLGESPYKDKKLQHVMSQIRHINATAPIRNTTFSQVPDLEWILDAKCFDLERARDMETALAHASGLNNFPGESVTESECVDKSCSTCRVPNTLLYPNMKIGNDEQAIVFCEPCTTIALESNINKLARTTHSHTSSVSSIALIESGSINLRKMHSWLASILWPDQDEDDKVLAAQLRYLETIGKLTTPELMEKNRRNMISGRMQIFRIKGILSVWYNEPFEEYNNFVDGQVLESALDENGLDKRRYIVQAVNDLWEINPASDSLSFGSPMNRICKLVVIGRNLNREALSLGFQSCLTTFSAP